MKAAILKAFGTPLAIETLPDPILGTGEVIVDVVAAPVLSYANEVFSGARSYPLVLPMAPGCGVIGRVRAFGPDATLVAVGDWVFAIPPCDRVTMPCRPTSPCKAGAPAAKAASACSGTSITARSPNR